MILAESPAGTRIDLNGSYDSILRYVRAAGARNY